MRRFASLILAIALSTTFACAEGGAPEEDAEPDTLAVPPDTGAAADTVAPADTAALASRDTLSALLRDTNGAEVGSALLIGTPNGLLVQADLSGLPAGTHAFHLHETGACEPDFEAAGGHLAPEGNAHGYFDAPGPHAGDMPNIHIPESGALTIEIFASRASVEALRDDDGSAVVIHAGADDYVTDPAGDAGTRIACGVVE